nr:hypothetical protein Iba_chr07bCG14790 [Ipomoea batatas]
MACVGTNFATSGCDNYTATKILFRKRIFDSPPNIKAPNVIKNNDVSMAIKNVVNEFFQLIRVHGFKILNGIFLSLLHYGIRAYHQPWHFLRDEVESGLDPSQFKRKPLPSSQVLDGSVSVLDLNVEFSTDTVASSDALNMRPS